MSRAICTMSRITKHLTSPVVALAAFGALSSPVRTNL
jgi:hypothetical protein